MINKKEYSNGLKVVVEYNSFVRSVSMGILVGVGSSYETKDENGISHFIEHVSFKGTKKRSSFDISDSIDGIGAQIDAFTSKDITCYYVKCTDEHIAESFEILSDLFCNSIYPDDELDKERGVIIEEINMSEDSPDDACLDLLASAYFNKDGFGQTILGSAHNVNNFTRKNIFEYKHRYYKPSNIVVSFAGNITIEQACELVEKNIPTTGPFEKTEIPIHSSTCSNGRLFLNKPIEQNHIAIGFPGVKIQAPDRFALICLNTVLGGGMSSRLFQSVREKQGLAYAVYSFLSSYKDLGVICVYAGVNPSKRDLSYNCILNEIKQFGINGISENELNRAKEQIKGSTVLSRENMSSVMISQGKRLLLTGELFDIDKDLHAVSELKIDQVNNVAKKYFSLDNFATAIVGKNVKSFI